jgi:predicted nucleic acid-binding protein
MQKVVSNSSPIIHLAKIGKIELLKEYFQIITISEIVYSECIVEGKDRGEVELIKSAEWIKVLQLKDRNLVRLLQSSLDNGESEAIALSLEIGADLILLDDSDAREKARLYGLKITGTIGILLRAKIDGKIVSLKDDLKRLKETGFWISDKLEASLLKEVGENP